MTTASTIAASLAGNEAALALTHAQADLQRCWPNEAVAPQTVARTVGPVSIPSGERFAVASGVAVVPLRGILTPDSVVLERWMGWSTYQGIEDVCGQLIGQDDVRAAVVDASSPGGLVIGLDAAASAIAALAAVKPVHVLVNPLAASAAYYLASQATDITMTPGAEVGSIGTMRMSDWPVQPSASGMQYGVHLSSHAQSKRPNPTEEKGLAEIRRSLDALEGEFLDAVARGRGLDRATLPDVLSMSDDPVDGGASYRGADAVERGLADSIRSRGDFYQEIFGRYAPKPSRSGSRALGASAKASAAMATANT